ncbi:MAG: hypothetical protein CMH56_13670 [Myxococcales bacterium]|nr:hypothetical protein [Myxococcales bacterium]|tara:strand:+ start:255 stop:1391 length:1137 start_codon:yes stop_codon:yes gene_type:complete
MDFPSPGEHVAAIAPSLIRTMAARRGPNTLDLGLGEPDLPLPPELLENAFAQMKAGPMGYTPNAGLPELRKAIAKHLGLTQANAWERIIVTCGSAGALSSAMGALVSPGDVVLTPDPSYPAYADLIRMFHGQNRRVALEEGGDGFIRRLEEASCEKTKGLIINTPVNPTGQVFSRETLERIKQWAEANNIWVISDEVYRTLYTDDAAPSLIDVYENAFVVGGLSKSISMTGFRLGWVLAPESCVNAICQVHRLTVTCAPRLSQLLALTVLEKPEELKEPAQTYWTRREKIRDACQAKGLKVIQPEGAFYLWIDVSAHTDNTLSFCLELHDATSVLAIPGEAFGPAGQGYVRLSYATDLNLFLEGLQRIHDHMCMEDRA